MFVIVAFNICKVTMKITFKSPEEEDLCYIDLYKTGILIGFVLLEFARCSQIRFVWGSNPQLGTELVDPCSIDMYTVYGI